jgi:hypothetical protein
VPAVDRKPVREAVAPRPIRVPDGRIVRAEEVPRMPVRPARLEARDGMRIADRPALRLMLPRESEPREGLRIRLVEDRG